LISTKAGFIAIFTSSSIASIPHTPAGHVVGVNVFVAVFTLVAVFEAPVTTTEMGVFVLVLVGVRVTVTERVSVVGGNSVPVCDGSGVFVRVGVFVAVGISVSVGFKGALVQVGGNWNWVSVAVGSSTVGGTLTGRIPCGKTWFGRIKINPKITSIPKVAIAIMMVRRFHIDIFIGPLSFY
jgi:hypothetical protein